MITLKQAGAGTKTNWYPIRDKNGSGVLPLQVDVIGSATYDVLARVSPDAPWVPIKTGATAGFLEAISWVPYVALRVTAGTGSVTAWVGEN